MADKNLYPQIPSTVWWGVRAILQRSPSATIDERTLSVTLDVQDAASRQYIAELKRAGILTEENKATPAAQRWRLDETYSEAVAEIMAATYPEQLLQIAPPDEPDRQKIASWFMKEGLGQGAAGNKAATYLLIASKEPNQAPSRGGAGRGRASENNRRTPTPKRAGAASNETRSSTDAAKLPKGIGHPPASGSARRVEPIPLNVNVQIHISADAGAEQIETIFAAMRRYLYDNPAH
ncbi:MAG TPA: hypothetical protein VII63_08190 [Caulobacteraceae bacterium]